MATLIDVGRRGRISVLTLKRPDGNRITTQMALEVTAALGAARQDSGVGACVITGHGNVFCLGGDYLGAGPTQAGGFSVVAGCDLAVMADDATLGLPEAAKGLFPFIALAIVKDALSKKLLFDIVYNARLMNAQEARALHLVNEVAARGAVLDKAIEAAEKASGHNPEILKLGRDLYYGMRGTEPDVALAQAQVALAKALAVQIRERIAMG
jgi:enoyl-CoA hydratase/carnithine racemase